MFPELLLPEFLVEHKKDKEAKSPSTNKNPGSRKKQFNIIP
jgi:hypothetical protein